MSGVSDRVPSDYSRRVSPGIDQHFVRCAGGATPYTVQAGNTVSGIAAMFGVTTDVVTKALLYPCYPTVVYSTLCHLLTDFNSDLATVWDFSIGYVIYIPGAFSSTEAPPTP